METDYPFADSLAARMLAEGLTHAKDEQGLSMRQIGKRMGYKTAVVLSHMANGRVPIPIDRAEEMADILELDKRSFVWAVLKQRHPTVDWQSMVSHSPAAHSDHLANELEAILGGPLKSLTTEQRAVMREVAAYSLPRQRWLSLHELYPVKLLREMFPAAAEEGIPAEELDKIWGIF